MNTALQHAIERLIGEATGEPARIDRASHAGGGCINNAQVITLADGRRYFVKSNAAPLPGMFEREAEGLAALADAATIRVPRPVGTGGGNEGDGDAPGVEPFIVMEAIETGSRGGGFSETFGRAFAELHRATTGERFGFDHDNYIGATPQPNTWCDDWVTFFREHRLGHQLRLARRAGLSDATMDRLGDKLLDRLDTLIGEPAEPACLLHGDLWGGNYLCDAAGEPVLIDPAAYRGRREADLAMTYLFGGFDARFYAAYHEAWPLADGADDRVDVYKLYHLLNHLNLFGSGYRSGCVSIMQRYAG
ncbi:MAG: phosphotransferase [Phycisphaera sp.]|nr:phosphotransferase [Phycisphaera sp.]